MALAELVAPNICRFDSVQTLRASLQQYIGQGAIGVVPLIALRPMGELEVWVAIGDTPIALRGFRCQVVILQQGLAVLRVLDGLEELRVAARVATTTTPSPRAPAPIDLPQAPSSGFIVPAQTDAGVFSEPSFEELIPTGEVEALVEMRPRRPGINLDTKIVLFDDAAHARASMEELRRDRAIWADCMRIPVPGPAQVVFSVGERKSAAVAANLFPGPKGGAIVQPGDLEDAIAKLESTLSAPADGLWELSGEHPLHKISTTAEFLGQPLVRLPTAAEMSNPTLPLILRSFIKFPDQRRVRFLEGEITLCEFFTNGQRLISTNDLDTLTRGARQSSSFEVSDASLIPNLATTSSLTALLGASFRRQLERFDVDALAAGMSARLDHTLTPTERAGRLIAALGLPDPHRRAFTKLERQPISLRAFTTGSTRFSWELTYLLDLNHMLSWS